MKQHRSILIVTVMSLAYSLAQAQQPRRSDDGRERQIAVEETPRITVRPTTIANAVDELAGQNVKVVNARVVGVFESNAFLIEDATRYEMPLRMRDRVLVLIDRGELHASPEELVAATVVVFGAARTLLGLRVSPEIPWPKKLDRQRLERLEIRAGVLATSVRTPEGNLLGGSPDDGAPAAPPGK